MYRRIFLEGPVSISEHYHSTYNKHIYIFGEKHDGDTSDRACGYIFNKEKYRIYHQNYNE